MQGPSDLTAEYSKGYAGVPFLGAVESCAIGMGLGSIDLSPCHGVWGYLFAGVLVDLSCSAYAERC